jgi:hypothetical protein
MRIVQFYQKSSLFRSDKKKKKKKEKERKPLRRQSRTAAALTAYGFEVRTPNPRGSSQQNHIIILSFLSGPIWEKSVIMG